MRPLIDADIAAEIFSAIDDFSEPCNRLSEVLRRIRDDDMRKALLRHLGDIMATLDGDIGFKVRREIGALK